MSDEGQREKDAVGPFLEEKFTALVMGALAVDVHNKC